MRRPGIGVGIFFLAAGVLFLLDALEVLRLRASFLLPLLLIGFGIALIAGGREPAPERAWPRERERRPPPPPPAPARREERTKEADEEGTAETPAEAEARPEDEEGSGPPPRQ